MFLLHTVNISWTHYSRYVSLFCISSILQAVLRFSKEQKPTFNEYFVADESARAPVPLICAEVLGARHLYVCSGASPVREGEFGLRAQQVGMETHCHAFFCVILPLKVKKKMTQPPLQGNREPDFR